MNNMVVINKNNQIDKQEIKGKTHTTLLPSLILILLMNFNKQLNYNMAKPTMLNHSTSMPLPSLRALGCAEWVMRQPRQQTQRLNSPAPHPATSLAHTATTPKSTRPPTCWGRGWALLLSNHESGPIIHHQSGPIVMTAHTRAHTHTQQNMMHFKTMCACNWTTIMKTGCDQ